LKSKGSLRKKKNVRIYVTKEYKLMKGNGVVEHRRVERSIQGKGTVVVGKREPGAKLVWSKRWCKKAHRGWGRLVVNAVTRGQNEMTGWSKKKKRPLSLLPRGTKRRGGKRRKTGFEVYGNNFCKTEAMVGRRETERDGGGGGGGVRKKIARL